MTKVKLAELMHSEFEGAVMSNMFQIASSSFIWRVAMDRRDDIALLLRSSEQRQFAALKIAQFIAALFGLREALDDEEGVALKTPQEIFDSEIMALRAAGQKEYAHDDDNAFANFERGAADLGISRESVLWVFAMKHKDGIQAYLNGHRSQRENVRGRINDLIVYSFILLGMFSEM